MTEIANRYKNRLSETDCVLVYAEMNRISLLSETKINGLSFAKLNTLGMHPIPNTD
jgi:hypothetical protein